MRANSAPFARGRVSLSGRRTSVVVASILALFLANALNNAVQNSGVCDELGAHMPAGYLYWTSGEFSGGLNNPPLGQLLIALPVCLLGLSYELFTEQHLLLFRVPVLLTGLLLAILVYLFASDLGGRIAGLAALFLCALSPNVLAHASLATLDAPVTCFIFLATYLLYRYTERPGFVRLLAFSAALSAAMLVKVQALLLVPLTVLVLLVFLGRAPRAGGREVFRRVASWLLIPLVAFVTINLVYLHLPWRGDHGWLPGHFLEALRGKLVHGRGGHFGYLLGDYSPSGWWYYFPVAIVLKTPIPTLVLVIVALCRRPSVRTVFFVLTPIALFLGSAMAGKVNIGVRHVLTIYPFLFVLGGLGAARLWQARAGRIVLPVLGAWYLGQALYIFPHHLSYFNLCAGGPPNGHRFLIDSNLDWGQNDRFLRHYAEESGIAYKIDPDPFRPTTGDILVNVNALYGVINGGPAAYAWLRDYEPVNQIAYTWFEYHVPRDAFPDRPRSEVARKQLLAHFFHVRERFAALDAPGFRLLLADSFAKVRAYDVALDELRSILARDPGDRRAFGLGGELTVRRKLGVLEFREDEYLTGFQTDPPDLAEPPGDETLAELAWLLDMVPQVSELQNQLGLALFHAGQRGGAVEAFRRAVIIDPHNQPARANLEHLVTRGASRDRVVAPVDEPAE